MDNKQKLFADIVKRHTTKPNFIKTFSWGTLNFSTKVLDLSGTCGPLRKVYSDVVDLMDNVDMMSYEMPIIFERNPPSDSIMTVQGWKLAYGGKLVSSISIDGDVHPS